MVIVFITLVLMSLFLLAGWYHHTEMIQFNWMRFREEMRAIQHLHATWKCEALSPHIPFFMALHEDTVELASPFTLEQIGNIAIWEYKNTDSGLTAKLLRLHQELLINTIADTNKRSPRDAFKMYLRATKVIPELEMKEPNLFLPLIRRYK